MISTRCGFIESQAVTSADVGRTIANGPGNNPAIVASIIPNVTTVQQGYSMLSGTCLPTGGACSGFTMSSCNHDRGFPPNENFFDNLCQGSVWDLFIEC